MTSISYIQGHEIKHIICHHRVKDFFLFVLISCLSSTQQGNFNSSVGSDGYMLSILTSGMSPVTSITEGLQQVSFEDFIVIES